MGTVTSSPVTSEPMETSPVIHLVTDAKGTVIHEVHVQMQELPLGIKTLAPEVRAGGVDVLCILGIGFSGNRTDLGLLSQCSVWWQRRWGLVPENMRDQWLPEGGRGKVGQMRTDGVSCGAPRGIPE